MRTFRLYHLCFSELQKASPIQIVFQNEVLEGVWVLFFLPFSVFSLAVDHLLLRRLLLGDVGGGTLIVPAAGPFPRLPSSCRPPRSPPAKPVDAGEGGGGS
jgi:hypothetical protein